MGLPAPLGVSASGKPPAGDGANEVLSGVFSAVGPSRPIPMRGPMNLAIWGAYNSALTTTQGTLAATVAAGGALAAGNAVNSANVPPGTVWGTFAGVGGNLVLPTYTLQGKVAVGSDKISSLLSTVGLLGATVAGPGIPVGTTVIGIPIPSTPAAPGVPATPGTVQISANPTAQPATNDPVDLTFALSSQAIATGVDANATFTGAAVGYSGSVQLERSFDGGATWLPANIGGSGLMAIWSAGTPINLSFGEPERLVYYRLNCTAYAAVGGVTLNYRLSTTGGAAESLAINQLS